MNCSFQQFPVSQCLKLNTLNTQKPRKLLFIYVIRKGILKHIGKVIII